MGLLPDIDAHNRTRGSQRIRNLPDKLPAQQGMG